MPLPAAGPQATPGCSALRLPTLASRGCHNKLWQTEKLQTMGVYSLITFLGPEGGTNTGGHAPFRGTGGTGPCQLLAAPDALCCRAARFPSGLPLHRI